MEATEYYNDTYCVRSSWLIELVGKSSYDKYVQRGKIEVVRRGGNGRCALVEWNSLPESIKKKAPAPEAKSKVKLETDTSARAYYESYLLANGEHLPDNKITEYTLRASAFNALDSARATMMARRAKCNGKFVAKEFWTEALEWHGRCAMEYGLPGFSNWRGLERAFNTYLNEGYSAIISKNFCNDSARRVSERTEKLLLALWRQHDKPFVGEVHRLYNDFVNGRTEFFDRATGELFRPEDFRYGDPPRSLEIGMTTVWNYLKDVVNETSVYGDRNGNFEYMNRRRPKHNRKLGEWSLSKISMDDVALSRKSNRGWVYKYIAVDVVSGYWFRPAYVVGKPTLDTVRESFRNMFCELEMLGLPSPGELEVEYHLMKDIDWLNEVFPFVRFCESATEKRAEHAIKALKYGAAKRAGHTRGRWYARHEAWRVVRNKVDGDFIEPEYQPQTIVADDLADIERHNNEPHPQQKRWPGLSRRDVFLKNVNPALKRAEAWRLYRFIGNETPTSIRNNDYCAVANEEFEIADFNCLTRLKPNNYEVTAYWLPDEAGSIYKVYLYQDGTYIGEALNRAQYAYNENKIEQTDADEAGKLHQQKRVAKFDRFIRENKVDLPVIGHLSPGPSPPGGGRTRPGRRTGRGLRTGCRGR